MDYARYKKLEFRRKLFRIFGASIDVSDPSDGAKVGFIEMKAWKLREDVRLYTDNTQQQEVLRIHARSIIDFGVTYDVFASGSDTPLFSLRRKGLKSTFIKDQWDILDAAGAPLGTVQETSGGLALVRRYAGMVPFVGIVVDLALAFVPLTYTVADSAGKLAANLTHRKNPIIVKLGLDTTGATATLDPRVPVTAAALLSVIDANKN